MKLLLRGLAALLAAMAATPLASSAEDRRPLVRVAVAANFLGTFEELRDRFEANHPYRLSVSSGATGMLYAQVSKGAPFEIFLAADHQRPARLEAEGLIVPGSRFTYAVGRLALWVPGAERVDATMLARPRSGPIAAADPELAPYGRAAAEVLEHLGITARLTPKLVYGHGVGQAYQFVASGAARMGFVAVSQLRAEPPSTWWRIPADHHAPIVQQAVLLKATPGAEALAAYLKSREAAAVLVAYGYDDPAFGTLQ